MTYVRLVVSRSTFRALDASSAGRFWKTLTPTAQLLIRRVHVESPLTVKQRSRLPRELAAKLA